MQTSKSLALFQESVTEGQLIKEQEEEHQVEVRDKEDERETELVMEEEEVVMEVKQVAVAEVEVGGGKSLLSRWRWRMCQRSRGDMQEFSDVGKGKSGMAGKGKGNQMKPKGKSKVLEGESGVGTSGKECSDIRDKIIGAIHGMREGLPWLDERLAELERYVEEEHSEGDCKNRVMEVLSDISSFASHLSALIRVVEEPLEMSEGRAVKLKQQARGDVSQFML